MFVFKVALQKSSLVMRLVLMYWIDYISFVYIYNSKGILSNIVYDMVYNQYNKMRYSV